MQRKQQTVAAGRIVFRHGLLVRVTHWINLVCMAVLLMSGLQISNAHPALYWGDRSHFNAPLLSIGAVLGADGGSRGVTDILGTRIDTTGILGLSRGADGTLEPQAFPAWATIPGAQWLAMGRRWHFFFAWLFVANGAAYGLYSLLSGRFRRVLVPSRQELRSIGRSISEHLRLRFPRGEAAKRYNVLQKLSYLAVIFVLGPAMVLTGLAMSPRLDAGLPWLLVIFGGRQSARSIHFLCAFTLLAFTLVHLAMVVASGPLRNLRSMITGWYDMGEAHDES